MDTVPTGCAASAYPRTPLHPWLLSVAPLGRKGSRADSKAQVRFYKSQRFFRMTGAGTDRALALPVRIET